MPRLVRPLPAVCTALALAACAGTPTRPRRPPVLELTSAERALLAGSNRFAFSLLHELEREAAPGENIFVSPLSASMALEMVLNGAAGATLDSMRATLGFPGLSIGEIDVSARHLIDLLRGLDPDVDLRIANSIWYRAGLPVASTFIDANHRFFDATVTALDFASPGAIPTINGWVARQTNGKIDRIVEAIARDLMLYVIDAVYFKAPWTSRFDKAMTRPMPFFAADGSRPQVPMMYQEGTFPAVRTPEYHAAELPYAGGAYAMVVVVPAEGRSVRDLVASLDADRWQALVEGLTEARGPVYLPRFTLEWQASLVRALTAMGMGIAFGDAADLSGITGGPNGLSISRVDQKTFVDVTEEGTEAAAVTNVGVSVTSLPPPVLRADRPFLFAVRERSSGALLFIGTLAVPPA